MQLVLKIPLPEGFMEQKSVVAPADMGVSEGGTIMYVVIDTETTGLNAADDRIVEFAAIGLDAGGEVEWEWCSLINPGDASTGSGLAIQVHQIYPRDIAGAPSFADFAGCISNMLSGRAIIGHNARFDLGMLAAEFRRLQAHIPEVPQICTSTLARQSGFRPYGLKDCCDALCIDLDGVHHALADARATTRLAHRLVDFSDEAVRKEVTSCMRSLEPWPQFPVLVDTPVARRIPPIRGRARSASTPPANLQDAGLRGEIDDALPTVETFSVDAHSAESQYLSAVEWVLEDREISAEQRTALSNLRAELCFSDEQVHNVHMTFIRGLAGSMWADGAISNHEQFDLDIVGELLNLSAEEVEYARDHPLGLELTNAEYMLPTGATVVFTGEMSIPRSDWKARAKAAGIRVTGSVSSRTDYLVVPFGETGSSKSRRARELGVRVVSEQRFHRMLTRLERES